MPQGRQAHIDAPLSNLAVAAFETMGEFAAPRLFPVVPVDKQSNKYFTIDQDSWQRTPTTLRAPKTEARRVEFKVSSDSYFADNYALATDNALEDLDNADTAIQLRENGIEFVTRGMLADYEQRVATLCAANVSSIQRVTGANAWDAVSSADIVTQVHDAKLSIWSNTGVVANTLVLDYKSYNYARRNQIAFARYQYVEGGLLSEAQLKALFEVDNIIISTALKNSNAEGGGASRSTIWGPTALVCYTPPAARTLKTAAYGLSFRWTPAGFPAPMAVTRQVFSGAGTKNIEVLEANYFQDEKVVASGLGFYINTKSGAVW